MILMKIMIMNNINGNEMNEEIIMKKKISK